MVVFPDGLLLRRCTSSSVRTDAFRLSCTVSHQVNVVSVSCDLHHTQAAGLSYEGNSVVLQWLAWLHLHIQTEDSLPDAVKASVRVTRRKTRVTSHELQFMLTHHIDVQSCRLQLRIMVDLHCHVCPFATEQLQCSLVGVHTKQFAWRSTSRSASTWVCSQSLKPGIGDSVTSVFTLGNSVRTLCATCLIRKLPKSMPASPFWVEDME